MNTIFIITSAVKSNHGSIYPEGERMSQTVSTINSIRKFCDSKIVVVENSDNVSGMEHITAMVDSLVHRPLHHYNKSVLEVGLVLSGMEEIRKREWEFDVVFKLSGRYELNEKFNIQNVDPTRYNLRKFNDQHVSTVMYGIPSCFFDEFQSIFEQVHVGPMHQDIEHTLYSVIPKDKVNWMNEIGVQGHIAPSGEFLMH